MWPGEALLFCGYNQHEGVAVTQGTRYILTGARLVQTTRTLPLAARATPYTSHTQPPTSMQADATTLCMHTSARHGKQSQPASAQNASK